MRSGVAGYLLPARRGGIVVLALVRLDSIIDGKGVMIV